MINPKTVKQIEQASVEERIEMIELILKFLKKDIKPRLDAGKPKFKRFKVRKFNLGEEIHVDRDELYTERGL